MRFSKKTTYILIAAGILLISGSILALNGWFGGGNSIPEDTMTRGLVGYWNMDEGGGQTAKDISSNGNNGTLGAAATAGVDDPVWTKGKNGGALKFDGKDDYVGAGLNNASLNITSAISIEAWINPNIIPSTRGVIARKAGVYYFQISATGNLEAYFYSTTSPGYHTMTTTVPLDKWTHVAVTYNGASVVLYQNGKSESFGDTGGLVSTIDEITIGSESGLDRYFSGSIDDVRIYNRALSAAEVKYHYNRGGPVAEWKFDEGSGSIAKDSTENNNDGTLTGATHLPTWISGKDGSALSFDGSDDYVSISSQNILQTEEMTVSAWVKGNSWTSGGGWIGLVSKRDPGTTGPWAIAVNATTQIVYFFQSRATTSSSASLSGVLDTISWHNITGTVDGNKIAKIYLDGVLVSSGVAGSGTLNTNSNPVKIGMQRISYSPSENFNGFIDSVRIYSYARAADEIRLDYNAGLATKFGPTGKTCAEDPASCMNNGLVGYWNMDEGGTSIAKDSSGNGNNGTLTNGPLWTKGKKGNALKFDGKDDYVDAGNGASLDITDAITIEAWAKRSNLSMDIVGKLGYYQLSVIAGKPQGRLYLGSYKKSLGDTLFAADSWFHIVMTYDKNTHQYIRVFSNGKEVTYETNENTGGLPITSDTSHVTMAKDIGSAYFSGSIDEVRIYNRALSPEEINYHYNEKKPVVQWDLDEGAGTTARDSAGNLDITFPATESERPTWTKP